MKGLAVARYAMRTFLASCLILGGAVAGGIFPGAWLAFYVAVGSHLSGSEGEMVCFVANLFFGLVGAFCGSALARAVRPNTRWQFYLLFPFVAGLVASVTGYQWLVWVISHADPPL